MSQASHRRLQTSHRWLQTSPRRVTDDYRQATNNYRRVSDESQRNHSTTFFEYIYKNTIFRKDMVSQMLLWKGGFYLKKESLDFDVYQSDGNSSWQ